MYCGSCTTEPFKSFCEGGAHWSTDSEQILSCQPRLSYKYPALSVFCCCFFSHRLLTLWRREQVCLKGQHGVHHGLLNGCETSEVYSESDSWTVGSDKSLHPSHPLHTNTRRALCTDSTSASNPTNSGMFSKDERYIFLKAKGRKVLLQRNLKDSQHFYEQRSYFTKPRPSRCSVFYCKC